MESNKARSWLIDLFRILLLFIVIHFHVRLISKGEHDILSFLDAIAVPLFLILSFYLSSKYINRSIQEIHISSRLKRLIIPTLFWSIVGFLLHPEMLSINNIALQFITGHIVNQPLYYMHMLMLFTIIAYIIANLDIGYRLIIYMGIIYIAFVLQYSNINTAIFLEEPDYIKYSIGRIIELIPYMSLGLLFNYFFTVWRNNYLAALLILACVVALPIANNYAKLINLGYGGLWLFFISIIIYTVLLLLKNISLKNSKFINTLGKYTFGIYLFHFLALEVLIKYLPITTKLMENYAIQFSLLFLIVSMGVCFAFDKLTRYKFSYLIS